MSWIMSGVCDFDRLIWLVGCDVWPDRSPWGERETTKGH
jgi:hypothetical protein